MPFELHTIQLMDWYSTSILKWSGFLSPQYRPRVPRLKVIKAVILSRSWQKQNASKLPVPFQVKPVNRSWPNVTVIESRAVNFLLMKLRNKDTQGRVRSAGHRSAVRKILLLLEKKLHILESLNFLKVILVCFEYLIYHNLYMQQNFCYLC